MTTSPKWASAGKLKPTRRSGSSPAQLTGRIIVVAMISFASAKLQLVAVVGSDKPYCSLLTGCIRGPTQLDMSVAAARISSSNATGKI